MVDDDEVVGLLRRMRQEAAETEKRCRAVAGERKGKKSAIQEIKELVSWVTPIQKRHVRDTRTGP
jgi:hypothetical protein